LVLRRSIARVLCLALLATTGIALAPGTEAANASGRSRRDDETVRGRYIVLFEDGVARPKAQTRILEAGLGFEAHKKFDSALDGFTADLTNGQVERLEGHPLVEAAVSDRVVRATSTVPLQVGDSVPPGPRRIGSATASSVSPAAGANVAVLDSGIDLTHPDLNAVDGQNCVGTGLSLDDDGHGTHVAGTIGAKNNGSGVTGVAPGTVLHAVKVLDATGEGSWSSVICGIEWITSRLTDGDPANDIRVVNMSLGSLGDPVEPCSVTTDPLHLAICNATTAGAVFVVAAGNDGWDFDYAPMPDVPAAYPEVLTVTAMTDTDGRKGALGAAPPCSPNDRDDRYASFSNFAATSAGEAHSIAAPGTCIRSTVPGGYATWSGTSMAAPHVAGAVALCLSTHEPGACSGLTSPQIVARMRDDAKRRTVNEPGYGFAGISGVGFGPLLWAGDSLAPRVTSHTPAASAIDVLTSAQPTVSFSESMNLTATQQGFSLKRASDGVSVSGSFSWSGQTLTFKPTSPLAGSTRYTATISTSARDIALNPLSVPFSWSFTTKATPAYAVSPSSIVLQAGSLASGEPASLAADDNVVYSVNSTSSTTRTSQWVATFSNVPNELASLKTTFRGSTSYSCSHTLAIWKWTTSSWVSLDTRSLGTTETAIERGPAATLADYVSNTVGPGQIQVRARCTAARPFVTRTDQLGVTYVAR
jgi:subtilisin